MEKSNAIMTWIERGVELLNIQQQLKNFIVYEEYTYKEGAVLIDEFSNVCTEIEYINQMSVYESTQKMKFKTIKIESKL